LIFDIDYFLTHEREAAGVMQGGSDLRSSMFCSILCRIRSGNRSGRCTEGGRREQEGEGVARFTGGIEIDRGSWQGLRTPTTKFVILRSFREGKKKGVRGGHLGAFIGTMG
jgi:hypothetical protein